MKKNLVVLLVGLLSVSHALAQVKTADRVLTWSVGEVQIERGKTIKVTYPLLASMHESGQRPELGTSTIRFFYDAGYLEGLKLENIANGYTISGLNQSNDVLGEIFGFPGGGGVFAQFNLMANELDLISLTSDPVHIMDISFTVKAGAKMLSCIPLVLDNHPGGQGLGGRLDYGYLPNEGGIVGTYYLDGITDQVFLADDEVRHYMWESRTDFSNRLIRSRADRAGSQLPMTALAASGCMEAMKKIKPVDLNYFRAIGQGEDKVFLEWTTLSEFDNDHFDIQRSGDGIAFTTIGTVKGSWNAVEESLYGFVDDQAHPGNLFYRIRQVDGSGNAVFSEVRMVTLYPGMRKGAGLDMAFFPNPTSGFLNIALTGIEAAGQPIAELLVFDAAGRMVLRKKEVASRSSLDLFGFKPGVYQVVVKKDGQEEILGVERIVLIGQ